jgi:hypothetical protein
LRALQDEIAERRGCWPDEGGIFADAANGTVGVTAMAGWPVVGGGRVLAIAARPQVHGDPLALGEDLHGPPGQSYLGLGTREAIGNAVEVALDRIVDADTRHVPFGEDVGLNRQGLECRPVEPYAGIFPVVGAINAALGIAGQIEGDD